MEAVAKPSSTRSQPAHSVQSQQQIAIEIISESPPIAQHQQQQPPHQQLQHQELQAHTLLQQCQQQQQSAAVPQPNVDIVLRESTRSNLVSRKKPSSADGKKSSGHKSRDDQKGEGKSVYRKFFKRIKTILDGADPDAASKKLGGRTPPRPSELARRQGSIADKACATVETSQRTLAVRMCGRGRLGTTVLDWCYRTIERLLFRPADDWPSEPVNGAVEGAAAITLTAPETLDSNGRVYRRQRRRRDAIALELLTGKEPEAEDLPVPARYYPDSLVELTRTARFTEEEIKRIYRGFKAECPTGIVKEETFKGIYSQFFPLGGKDSK
uniref:Uncharacterized protein n=1 Tax=Anopheles stephensi TaxID=30069 RepID=A0A182Y8D3_ANOST